MTLLVGGQETGLLNTSIELLDRNDNTGTDGELPFVNVANGNLLIQQQDVFMPSQGDDYYLTRTYNARGRASDAHQHEDARWSFSTTVRLTEKNAGAGEKYYEIEFGDGSVFDYQYDTATGLYITTDGSGAYGTIEELSANSNAEPSFVLTRADQDRLYFDSQGHLLQLVDTNGVTVDYVYAADRLIQVLDDQGHVLNYVYQNGVLFQVTDESEGVLVEYHYDSGRLSEVIDRYGHSTQYFYTNDGFLERIVLPEEQMVNGQLETYEHRELTFTYETVNWRGDNKATAQVVTQITNAAGGVTTFDYDFDLVTPGANGEGLGHTISNGKGHFKHGDATTTTDDTYIEDKFFQGGSTTVVDALGNDRAYSNDQSYVEWRTENGFYASYDPNLAATDPAYQVQVDAIRVAHALTYTYRADGYVTEVIDQQGFHTSYGYDDNGNLISVTDRNGWGATNSDSDYYRALRADLGYVDGSGNGKLVASLTSEEVIDILESFTSHSSFDERGNMISLIDNVGNETTSTFTSFNKLESSTSAIGNALVTSDEQVYQDRRAELGYAALFADLNAADAQAILDLHTTYLVYDVNQNLIERRDAGGDITRYEYDSYGNQTKRTVFLDAGDLLDPAKQQITTYAYDGFGNNISATDGEGHQAFSEYDHFGNLTRFTDANGGVTQFTYDADNRLLTVTDPEGHVTVNTYDAVGNRITVIDANGHTVTRVYDLNNNLIAVMDPSNTDPAQDRLTQYEYDVVGSRTAVIDAEGRRTEYTFNVRRELVEVQTETVDDQDGQQTQYVSTFAYDGSGNRISATNNRGYTTEYLYTQNNLVRQQTDANGHITRIEYDANNNQISIVAGLQLSAVKRQVLSFRYDEEDQLVTQTDAEGNVTQYAYDAPGNRVAMTDANGHVTEYEYDAANRLIRETFPDVTDSVTGFPVSYTVEHRYDANGNVVETVDENGHSTRYSFDKDDKLVMVEDANGIKTVFEYDSRHNRTAVVIGADATVDVDGRVTLVDVNQAQATRYTYDEFNQLITQTDGVGNALAESDAALYQTLRQELGYAALTADLSTSDQAVLRELYSQHFSYDNVGNLITHTDHLDQVTQSFYDSLNRLTTIVDAANQVTGFRYDGNGNRTSLIDAEGRVSQFSYDALDRLTDTTDPLGTVTHREYDVFGNLVSAAGAYATAEARTSTYSYDLNNRVLVQTDPEGHIQSYEYDAVGNRLRMVDGRGNATQYVYDALDRNIKIIDPQSFETRFEYDGVGNRLSLTDPRGGIATFTYDPGNRLISTTDSEGREATFVYDARDNRIEQRTAAGTVDEEVTRFEYDAENNLRRVIDAEGEVTENDYDSVYNRVAVTDANGHTTYTEFDAVNRVISVTDAEGQVTSFAYDAVGNTLSQTDALGRVTTFGYDDNDRLIIQTAADSVETHYGYDLVGNRAQITWAANTAAAATDTFVYDLDDRLISQTDAEGNTTTYSYDANDNRTAVTDPNGNTTVYSYDANNRVIQINDPEANTTRYVYDANGNRIQVVDGRNNTSSTFFNADNEVVLSVDAEGYASSYVYDNNGNLIRQMLHMQPLTLPIDPASMPVLATAAEDQSIAFEYDKLNRVTARIDAEGYRTEYVYDAVGNQLETHQYIDLAGTQVATTYSFYNDVNRQISRVSAEGYLTEYMYDAVGNQTVKTVFDETISVQTDQLPLPVAGDIGRAAVMEFDALNRVVRETSPLGVHTDYQYDARGNLTATINAAGTADERTTAYTYDSANRLISTTDALGIISQLMLDANGNVVERRDALGSSDERLTTYSYDANNRMISQTDALGVMTTTLYDANGNVVSQTQAAGLPEARTQTFEYDQNNRLIAEVNGEGERSESVYDGAGNRTQLILAPGLADERSNHFKFDRDNRLIAVVDGVGVRTEYSYDGADNKLETVQAAGIAGEERHSFYQYDLDNRVVQISDPMGGVTQYTYDVLGNQTEIVNANGGIQTNQFDAIGRLVSSLSSGDVLTAHSYDLRGNIISTTQSFGDGSDARTTTYGYDLLDQQTQVIDPEGFSTSIAYDVFGNQIEVTHGQYLLQAGDTDYSADKAALAFVQSNQFSYDAANRMLSLTDGEGNVVAYSYDAVGNRVSMTEAANTSPRTTTYQFDLANRLIETHTPEGGISRNRYDETGLRITESVLQSDDGITQTWSTHQFEYDANARLSADIDSYGTRTEFEYDAMGNKTITRMAAGTIDERITRIEYDLNNRISAEIDGEGNLAEFAYDSLGNRIQATDALGRVARFYFDGANHLTHVLDAEGYINQFNYDSAGNRIGETIYMTRYSGSVDNFVPPVATSDGSDRNFTYTFDGNNRVISQASPDGSVTERSYDAAGNLILERLYANTNAPRDLVYQYDLNNRLIHFTDVDGTITTFTYDSANNKTAEVIISATDPNATRETVYSYDLNNRVVSQIFDPSGLNLVQTMSYDFAGNLIAQVDANNHLKQAEFDLNNRLIRQIDGMGNDTLIAYDAVGNRIAITDANGNTTEWIYDDNNRAIQQILPEATLYTLTGGFETTSPTITRTYDAVGNETQVVDAAGFVTTRYYDSNSRLVAEISGDNVLTELSYNAAGEQISETLYMTRLSAAAHDPATNPAAPAGDSRTTTYEYDLGGRVTRIVHPQIEGTTLSGADTSNPTYSQTLITPEEVFAYDAFGNQVEAVDANGSSVLNFYDSKGRVIAKVDGEGYLIEYEYDAQDNVLEERVYAEPLERSLLTAGQLPTPPAGAVHETSRIFDAASRVIEERSPLVEVFDPATLTVTQERVVTLYSYDGVGNQTSKTLAAGSSQAFTEYTYYDAQGNQIAVIDGNRTVNLFGYDANGNQTLAKRLFNTVGSGVDLTLLTGTTDFASLVGNNGNDQALTRIYDALNRLSTETELMGSGSEDDLIQQFGYDANGNRTRAIDEDGFVRQFSLNALGNMVKSISPDGSGTVYEYDAAGNQILAFTGQLDSLPAPATSFNVTLTNDGLEIGWALPEGSNVRSYVVYDHSSQAVPADYASQGAAQATWHSNTGAYTIPSDQFSAGDALYYRVVTQDAAGSLTWSSEQVLTVPPQLGAVSVTQTGPNALEVIATFEAGAVSPSLFYGMPGAANTEAVMQSLGNGQYKVTLNGVTNPQELVYQFAWKDAAGATYFSTETPFEATDQHTGITTHLTESAITSGTDTLYKLNIESTLSDTQASDLLVMAARWERTDVPDGATGSLSVEGVDSGLGYSTYNLISGVSDALEAGTYTVTLTGVGESEDAVLEQFEVVVGSGLLDETNYGLSWAQPEGTNGSVVVIDGQRATAELSSDNRLLINPVLSGPGSVGYNVFYGTNFADTHDTSVTSTEQFNTDNSTVPATVTSLGFDLDVDVAMSATELSQVSGDLQMAWRPAGSGLDFANTLAMNSTTTGYATTLTALTAGEYDIKLYYTDLNGDDVIVDWLRANTDVANTSVNGRSISVQATEFNGELTLSNTGELTLDAGLYSGSVSGSGASLAVASNATGEPGGSQAINGSDAGYFVETQYNALNHQIATNAETGLWRELGVDAGGNVLVTENYGLDRSGSPIITFSSFDANNREVARFDAVTTQDDGSSARAVTRFAYDVFGNLSEQIDARGGIISRTWNAMGKQLSETDQLYNSTTYRYDRLGNLTAEIDGLGNTQYSFYDLSGNMTQKIDGEGNSTTYTYDVFGRKTQVVNALGQSVQMSYDQRDRLVSAEDGLGQISTYAYDGRDNRIQTIDANGHTSSQEWDGLGRVVDTITYQNGNEIHERKAYDAYGNLISEIDAEGRATNKIFGSFGRPVEAIDQGGVQTFYTYDDQGRMVREYSSNGKDILRSYDENGRLLNVSDLATGVSTAYSYDIAGNRLSETVTTADNAHDRSVSYAYDAIGQMVRWADSVTGMHTAYQWDAAGNMSRSLSDLGYDPDAEGLDASTRFVDHQYSYDGNNRIIQIDQRGELERQYSYDAAGNRIMESSGGQITEYSFDANGRVIMAEQGGVKTADWQYDNAGNVLQFRTFKADGTVESTTTKQYFENNRNYYTNDDGQQTTLTMDLSGRITRTKLVDDGSTYYFDHIYNASGLETRINARGNDIKGSTVNTYDANNQLIASNKGEGDNQDRAETLSFIYNNDGQILYRFHDTGEGSKVTETEYAYANGYAVGETGNTEGDIDGNVTLLDTGRYNLMQAYGDSLPASAITFYTVQQGDDLQSIAGAVYGNPSLWFILAEANGLEPGAPLSEGQRLQIPNTIESGRLTADTHMVYDEGEIIGSTLPNLKSDPPGGGGCGGFLAIIIVIIIIIVVVYTGVDLSGFYSGLGLGESAAFVASAATIAAATSAITQVVLIAAGYQESFSWKAVAAEAISAAFTAGAGLVAGIAKKGAEAAKYAKIASAALSVAGAATKQLILHGKITSWTSLAAAGIGGALNASKAEQMGALQRASSNGSWNQVEAAGNAYAAIERAQTALNYVTPWVQLAETSIRNDGQLQPGDWVSAVGGTLSNAMKTEFGSVAGAQSIDELVTNVAIDAAVAGSMSLYDRDVSLAWLASGVGNEVGGYAGYQLATAGHRDAVKEMSNTSKEESSELELAGSKRKAEDSEIIRIEEVSGGIAVDMNPGISTAPLPQTSAVSAGDSFWSIARNELGGSASDAEVLQRVQQYMEANKGVDPRRLQIGAMVNVPGSDLQVSAETGVAYTNSDKELRAYYAEQAAPKLAKEPRQGQVIIVTPSPVPSSDGADILGGIATAYQTAGHGSVGGRIGIRSDWLERTYKVNSVTASLDEIILAPTQSTGAIPSKTQITVMSDLSLNPFKAGVVSDSGVARQVGPDKLVGTLNDGNTRFYSTVETATKFEVKSLVDSSTAKSLSILSWAGDIYSYGDGVYNEYKQEGEFNSRVTAAVVFDGFQTVGSASISGVAGTITGSVVTAGGAGTTVPLGVVVGIGTSYIVDNVLDSVYKDYLREPLIDIGASAIDTTYEFIDKLDQFYNRTFN